MRATAATASGSARMPKVPSPAADDARAGRIWHSGGDVGAKGSAGTVTRLAVCDALLLGAAPHPMVAAQNARVQSEVKP